LAGLYPQREVGDTFELAHIALLHGLPISLPARLVVQGRDIRAAQASFHRGSGQVGVAVAARLPDIVLGLVRSVRSEHIFRAVSFHLGNVG